MTIVKRHEITDLQWSRILPFIPAPKGRHGGDVRLILSSGNTHDSKIANELMEGYKSTVLLADKAYNSQEIFNKAVENGMEVIIPSKSNSKNPRIIDKHKYVNCVNNKQIVINADINGSYNMMRKIFNQMRYDKDNHCINYEIKAVQSNKRHVQLIC